MKKVPIVSIVGRSQSGKTVLMEHLIAEFKRRGYRVAALKHSGSHMEIDHPGKDSWRFARAGSDAILVSSPEKLAFVRNLKHEVGIDEIMRILGPDFDIILAEGFKKSKLPKLEVHRMQSGSKLSCSPGKLSAIISDGSPDTDIPLLPLGDAAAVADFIEQTFITTNQTKAVTASGTDDQG